MKKLILTFVFIFLAFFFLTQKNRTITVKSTIIKNDKCYVIDVHNDRYEVPVDTAFGWNFVTNWVLLNVDAMEDAKTLQIPGQYYVRTYGIFTPKITAILKSADDELLIITLFKVILITIKEEIKK